MTTLYGNLGTEEEITELDRINRKKMKRNLIMSNEIVEFLNEMRDLTNDAFIYQISHWSHSNGRNNIIYELSASIAGFQHVTKESEAELIEVLDIVRNQVLALIEAKELNKRANTKLIKQTGKYDEHI